VTARRLLWSTNQSTFRVYLRPGHEDPTERERLIEHHALSEPLDLDSWESNTSLQEFHNLRQGWWWMSVSTAYGEQTLPVRILNARASVVSIDFTETGSISGTLQTRDGVPFPNGYLWLTRQSGAMHHASRVDMNWSRPNFVPARLMALSDSEGRFKFESVPMGTWEVITDLASGEGRGRQHASLTGREMRLTLKPGEMHQTIQVSNQIGSVAVGGTVRLDNKSVYSAAHLIPVLPDGRLNFDRMTRTFVFESNAGYRFAVVGQNTNYCLYFTVGETLDCRDPRSTFTYMKLGWHREPSIDRNWVFASGELRGIVTLPDGTVPRELAASMVRLPDSETDFEPMLIAPAIDVTIDPDGKLRVPECARGRYRLMITSPDTDVGVFLISTGTERTMVLRPKQCDPADEKRAEEEQPQPEE
jgi:hypothetical protein